MEIVSVINYKGGVGKTTLTANLGAELAWRGYSVLLVDLDAQASLTFSFIKPDDWLNNYSDTTTIKQWFDSFESGTPFFAFRYYFRSEPGRPETTATRWIA